MNKRKLIIGALLFLLLAVIIPTLLWIVSDRSAPPTMNLNVHDAHALVIDGAFLLDVRTQDEWDELHVPGAVLIPLDELEDRLAELPENEVIVVMCRSGNRSQTGRDILIDAGFAESFSMDGGINEWDDVGYEVE